MHELNLVDKTFDLKLASEYHLSIQAGSDGFSFCILDLHRNKYLALRHLPLIVGKPQFIAKKIETIFEQEEILNASFKTVSITYSTNKVTLVPKIFSSHDSTPAFADFTFGINRTEDILTNELPGQLYNLAYCIPKELLVLF